MNLFSVNLMLALAWAALQDSFSLSTLLAGYIIGFGALWLAQPLYGRASPYFLRSWRAFKLALYFIWDLLMSSVRVAATVLMPWRLPASVILEMPLDAKTDIEILLVTNLISLTPGTLSLDVSEDRSILYVHTMFGDDPEDTIASLKNGMERMVMEVFEK